MHLWQRRATAGWLAKHESALEELSRERLAVTAVPGQARALVQVTCDSRVAAQELTRKFGGSFAQLPRDWAKQFFTRPHAPLRIGRRLFVVAESDPSYLPQLVIPAAGAFGTGDHATTGMALRLLEEVTRKWDDAWRLLDAGSGTGILALAARSFGAKEAHGIDFDPRAVAHARVNARLNQISRCRFVRQDLRRWRPAHRYDVITANLFSQLLIAALPKFRRALRAHGLLITSGILREQAPAVLHALDRAGFTLSEKRRRGKWVALLATRKT